MHSTERERACASNLFSLHVLLLTAFALDLPARGPGRSDYLGARLSLVDGRRHWKEREYITFYIFSVSEICFAISQFLCLQRCGLVCGDGSDSPALLTAMTLNWYHLPSLSPGTRASKSSIFALRELSGYVHPFRVSRACRPRA